MTNEELDRYLAEKVMGWGWIDKLHLKDRNGDYVIDGTEWHPTTDIAQVYICEDKVLEMELEQEYSDALEKVLKEKYGYAPSTFQIAHATPRERGEAIYEATKEQ